MGFFRKRFDMTTLDEIHRRTLHKNLEFTALEQFKLLRTNLEFTLSDATSCPIIGVTSSIRGEGKSTTAINLSYVLAEKGSRVLLIDGDLRLPTVAKKLDIASTPGLTNMLIDRFDKSIEDLRSTVLDNWYVLPSGDIPPNPSELLGSGRMRATLEKLSSQFDYIVIDLPPVNLVSDALSISPELTGMLVVVREEYTEKKELENCFRHLRMSNVNVLGCVMTGAGGRESYSRYKRYKKYYSYGK